MNRPLAYVALFVAATQGCSDATSGDGAGTVEATGGRSGDAGAIPFAEGGATPAPSANDAATPSANDAAVDGAAPSANDAAADGGAPVSFVFRLCNAAGAVCADIDRYAQCLQTECGSSLASCFGVGYATNDFAGGRCEPYAQCVLASEDPCANGCTPMADCAACLSELSTCVQSSGCSVSACEPGASPSSDAGVGGADGGDLVTGGCAELSACCDSIADPSGKEACRSTAEAAARESERSCAVVYSTYHAAGAC